MLFDHHGIQLGNKKEKENQIIPNIWKLNKAVIKMKA